MSRRGIPKPAGFFGQPPSVLPANKKEPSGIFRKIAGNFKSKYRIIPVIWINSYRSVPSGIAARPSALFPNCFFEETA
ncbi:MAG TPA: hypothetical protein DEB39_13610 [Planctomycetaceae bacterium]|nr:hypothetical protein [Planctomycetaceae bacterium]